MEARAAAVLTRDVTLTIGFASWLRNIEGERVMRGRAGQTLAECELLSERITGYDGRRHYADLIDLANIDPEHVQRELRRDRILSIAVEDDEPRLIDCAATDGAVMRRRFR